MPTIRRLLLPLLALSALAACSDDDNLPDPTDESMVDTVTVGSLTDTPITTASGFSVSLGPVRTDLSAVAHNSVWSDPDAITDGDRRSGYSCSNSMN